MKTPEWIIGCLKTVAPTDINFRGTLEEADAEQLAVALAAVEATPAGNKVRIARLRGRLKSLGVDLSRAAADAAAAPEPIPQTVSAETPAKPRSDELMHLEVVRPITRSGQLLLPGRGFAVKRKYQNVHVERWLKEGKIKEVPDKWAPAAPPPQAPSGGLSLTELALVPIGRAELLAEIPEVDAVRLGLREVDVALIDPSPWQPRTDFDLVYISELAQTIHQVGLSQAPVVRPSPTVPGRWELVVGECRLRAIRDVLRWEKMPVVVKALTDGQAIEETTVENLQRRDLNAMEVARAYRRLMDLSAHTVETLVRKLGRSESSVRDALKLLDLSPAAAAAVQAGRLPTTTAVLLARLPAGSEAQRKVERAILQPGKHDAKEGEGKEAVLSVRAAKELTDKARETIRLDEEWAATAAAAQAAGQPTMATAAAVAAGIFFEGSGHHYLKGGCGWINRADRCYEDPQDRNYETLLRHLPETSWVLTQAPDGTVLRLMHGEDAKRELRAKGYDWAADKEEAEAARQAEQVERQRRETERHEQRQAEAGRLVDAAVSAAVKGEKARAMLLRSMLSPIGYEDGVALQSVCQRRGIPKPEGKQDKPRRGSDGTEEPHWFGALLAAAQSMTSAELLGLHLEMRLYDDTAWRKSPEPEFLRGAAELLGLEPMPLEPEEEAKSANVCPQDGEDDEDDDPLGEAEDPESDTLDGGEAIGVGGEEQELLLPGPGRE